MHSIPVDDVILYRVDGGSVASPRPKEGDDESMTATKAFVMTCLIRRNEEPAFERDMKHWLDMNEDKVKGIRVN